jgi:hypothetical protein
MQLFFNSFASSSLREPLFLLLLYMSSLVYASSGNLYGTESLCLLITVVYLKFQAIMNYRVFGS